MATLNQVIESLAPSERRPLGRSGAMTAVLITLLGDSLLLVEAASRWAEVRTEQAGES